MSHALPRRLRGDRAPMTRAGCLLMNGGASRGNLLSGEADEVILTVSRLAQEKTENPGYRAFLANGFNVTRALVLFAGRYCSSTGRDRSARRDFVPRGHRVASIRSFAPLCVLVRDLIVYGVLTDMMRGRAAVYATFSSYDEVAHHSGLQRADTLEALRKLDQQFDRIASARVSRPALRDCRALRPRPDPGRDFKQRNGYGLDDLVERSLASGEVSGMRQATNKAAVGHALHEAESDASPKKTARNLSDEARSCSAPATSASSI